MTTDASVAMVRRFARPIAGDAFIAPVLDVIGDARIVLIGEASHGTDEFYRMRARITRTLIEDHGFTVVAVEADWPDAYRADRYVRLASDDPRAREALADFTRFPRWMWRNEAVVEFLEWLRGWNAQRDEARRVSFCGLDLYSLHRSINAVLDYLQQVDPAAGARARTRYRCFDIFGEDMQLYGYASTLGLSPSCETQVVSQLVDLQRQAAQYATRDGRLAADAYFVAEQNARVVRNAESYYRAMFRNGTRSWNLRDGHMLETLDAVLDHASPAGRPARAVVWAHNSHLGDARATAMHERGEWNLGQLVRERFGSQCRNIGFTTHKGWVTAASGWDEPAVRMRVRPSLPGSWERLFHESAVGGFVLDLTDPHVRTALAAPRLERAIGVIYRPDTERASHYFQAVLPHQFDVVIHIDETAAVVPLETWSHHEVDLPETYPTGV
jgi:erythromycin esterase-like protein